MDLREHGIADERKELVKVHGCIVSRAFLGDLFEIAKARFLECEDRFASPAGLLLQFRKSAD
jgi:hypothetical protein